MKVWQFESLNTHRPLTTALPNFQRFKPSHFQTVNLSNCKLSNVQRLNVSNFQRLKCLNTSPQDAWQVLVAWTFEGLNVWRFEAHRKVCKFETLNTRWRFESLTFERFYRLIDAEFESLTVWKFEGLTVWKLKKSKASSCGEEDSCERSPRV